MDVGLKSIWELFSHIVYDALLYRRLSGNMCEDTRFRFWTAPTRVAWRCGSPLVDTRVLRWQMPAWPSGRQAGYDNRAANLPSGVLP
jgi:hypothetical protein